MQQKQYILLLSEGFQGAVVPFPLTLELPQKKIIGERTFFKTGRKKTTPDGITSTIYVEQGVSLNLDEYADEEAVEENPILEKVQDVPASAAIPTVPKPIEITNLPVTTIYGTSDDLIEFEGHFSGEIGAYGTDDAEHGVLIVISDGTLLEVKYGKGGQGIWGITVLKKGAAYAGFEPCDDEEADIYSDVVTLRGDIKFAYASRDWEKVQ